MPKIGYEWELGSPPPTIEAHSLAKHDVLREYLSNYVQILCKRPVIEQLNLTLVDGFSGGGLYTHYKSGEIIYGSPLILLNTIKEAEIQVNITRKEHGIRNTLKINTNYYFVDKSKANSAYLHATLKESEFKSLVDKTVHLINDPFNLQLDKIICATKNMPRSQRCIFLLDQYGYSDVSFSQIKNIFNNFNNAEVILTFATDSLINFISDESYEQYKKIIESIGLHEVIDVDELIEAKEDNPMWRYVIETQLVNAIKSQSGARFFTPFFIISRKSNRAYWLVHLSMHPRAQDEMTRLHWKMNNHFQHYGKAGLNMLGYDPANDATLDDQLSLGFMFDNNARQLTHDALVIDIPSKLSQYKQGINYSEFFTMTCNNTPADDELYREALTTLLQCKEIEIIGESDEIRRSGKSIKNSDMIRLSTQRIIIF